MIGPPNTPQITVSPRLGKVNQSPSTERGSDMHDFVAIADRSVGNGACCRRDFERRDCSAEHVWR